MLSLSLLYEMEVLSFSDINIVHYDDRCTFFDLFTEFLEMLVYYALELVDRLVADQGVTDDIGL